MILFYPIILKICFCGRMVCSILLFVDLFTVFSNDFFLFATVCIFIHFFFKVNISISLHLSLSLSVCLSLSLSHTHTDTHTHTHTHTHRISHTSNTSSIQLHPKKKLTNPVTTSERWGGEGGRGRKAVGVE